jgi:hypothetical protein
MRKLALIVFISFLTVVALPYLDAMAQSNYQGTGDNFGRGWRSDGRGGQQGTGDNFGRGWRSDGRGGQRGTGDNFGRGWRSR